MKKILLLAALVVSVQLPAADLSLKLADKEPPKELEAAIRAKLQSKSIQLLNGDKPAYEFWLVSELPLESKPASFAKAIDSVKQAALLGAIAVPASQRDYRDDELSAGIYTLRLALQPSDGNHLGTSEFSYFAVLVPAKLDPKPDGITTYKALVSASRKGTSTDHPVILSLRPATSEGGESPSLQQPAPEHKSVRVKIPAVVGGEKTSLLLEIVYEGKAKK